MVISDIIQILIASMENPSAGTILNVADDLPSTRYDVLTYACRLINIPIQSPDRTFISGTTKIKGNRGGSKRVDNTKMRKLLQRVGKDMIYPDYRSGLLSLYQGDPVPLNYNFNVNNFNENNLEIEESTNSENNNNDKINNNKTELIEALERTVANQSKLLNELNLLLNKFKMDL